MPVPSIQLLRALRAVQFDLATACSAQPTPILRNLRLSPRNSRPLPRSSSSSYSFSTLSQRNTPAATTSSDRGPPSKEDTQTDFGTMNVLGNAPPPTTSIDACLSDGFHLDNGLKIDGGSGCLLISGEAFTWRPWEARGLGTKGMLNGKGHWTIDNEAWGVLDLVWPRPDMLILGLGASTYPIALETRRYINGLGIRVEIQDTRNAAAQFNLLATERGVSSIAAAMIPIGWRGQ